MNSNSNILYEKVTIYDIQHQDIFDVYKDKYGSYYDLNGNLINIEYFINYNKQFITKSYKDKKD
jgi:hypothetical protein